MGKILCKTVFAEMSQYFGGFASIWTQFRFTIFSEFKK